MPTGHRFFAPGARVVGQTVVLPDDEAHHLRHVLRLGAGDEVGVFDGRGQAWAARVARVEKRGVTVELVGAAQAAAEAPVPVRLALALLKGDQMDAVVRDATALGVTGIVPMLSEHIAVPPRASKLPPIERWQRIAVAAAKQCGRAVVPTIGALQRFDALVSGASNEARLLAVEPAMVRQPPAALNVLARPASAILFVGPEGGWSDREIDLAITHESALVTLGPRRLTAELAPVVLLSALRTVWGW